MRSEWFYDGVDRVLLPFHSFYIFDFSITKLFGLNAPERVDVRVWNEIESSTREMASGLGYDDIALGEAVEFMKERYPQLASGKP